MSSRSKYRLRGKLLKEGLAKGDKLTREPYAELSSCCPPSSNDHCEYDSLMQQNGSNFPGMESRNESEEICQGP